MNRRVQLALATLVSAFAPLPSARAESPSATLAQAGRTSNEVEQVTVHGSQAGGFSSKAREGDSPREVTDAASLVEPLAGVHVRRLGADDGYYLWVGDRPVIRQHLHRGATVDQYMHTVKLAKGRHRIMIKVDQGGGGFEFLMRLTTPKGERLPGVKVWN